MSSTWSFHGGFSWWIHEEDFACSQTGLIDFSNLFFASLVFLTLLFSSIRRNSIISCTHSDFINLSVSICCVLTGVLYIGVGSWDSIAKNHENPDFKIPISCFIRGFIWIILGLSLIVKLPKWIKSLVSVWWVLFFVISSCINVEILSRNREIGAMILIPWIANSFLFFCAMRNFSGFFSCLAFSWMNPLLSLGYSKPLILEDIPSLESEDESNSSFEKFIGEWELNRREKGSSNRNLVFWTLFKIYWKEMVIVGLLTTVRTMSVAVSPLLLYLFVNHFDNEAENTKQGLILVGFLVVAKVFESLSYRQFFFVSRKIGLRMRSALMVAVYKKQLDLSNSGKMRNSTGEIVNYIAIDAYRMGEFPMWFHSLWSYILQLFLVIFVLFEVVGLGVVPGLFPLFLFAVLNIPFAKSLQKCQSELMVAQDRRLRSTSEILNSMKIIKLQSWEENCKRLIDTLRETEFKWLAEAQYKKIYNTALYWISPTIISSVIFFGCVFFSTGSLDAGTVFTVLAALRGMSEPVRMIPEALSALIQVNVSLDRINSFLLEDELKKEPKRGHFSCDSEHQIQIKSGCFSWNPESAIPTLRNVNLEAKKGEKISVCGPVGAGKSSLLYSILGEIPRISGTVDVCGLIAYVSQASWIQSGTIRENILFGKPMDQTKYENAIKSCALDKDLDGFEYGDLTEIGERGLNMSGGQKQRIQLARALYNDADIYLLDDPFSAVDAHTAVTLFNDCVMGALAKKTVVLVTHQVEFLSKADKIMVMDCGQVTQSGNYEELLMEKTAFEKLVVAHNNSLTTLNPSIDDKGGETRRKNAFKLEENNESNYIRKESNEGEILVKGAFGVQLTEEEERGIGEVGWKPFLDYILVPKGPFFLCSNIVTQSGFVVLQAAASYWLAYGVQDPKISSFVLIGVYTLVSGLSAIFVFSRSFFAAVLGLSASKSFFFRFNDAIFNAPMLFFDSTPVGRILTRASSDMSVLDFDIPFSIAFVLAAGIELIATIGIMASATWQVLIVGVFATLASKYVQGYYQASARELMRINGTTKAPIMNYAAETSLGVATIRAFDMTERFFNNYLKLVDSDAKTIFFSNAAMEWLILRTETLQNLTLFTAALLLVLLPKGYISPGIVGLSLSYALALTNTQVFLSRWYSSLSNYIISVERIKQFMNIPPEPPGIIKDNRPPSKWPSMGRIELQDLKIRYRSNFPLVLKGITCTFREGDRVGIVGRTGSGKTTLISALFRLVEPNGGRIIIDGIDICSIGLKDLRMKLSIIPQEPTLFKGSVRTNLDPLGLYSDDEIWKALELCQLKVTISSLPNLLDSSVSDEGENWSMGQRQLFCLGRVLLKRNKILVLDEATASIDSATDAILQRIIREQFSNCTVITVAHRVPTVIDSDMVMVLSFGKMVEYDEPSKLMEMSSSSFSKLVAEYWSSCTREDST